MIDSHAHLTSSRFRKDRDAVIDRALEAGVTAMVSVQALSGDVELFPRLLRDGEPALSPTRTSTPESLRFRAWACPWLP